jgi:hypothetical protein
LLAGWLAGWFGVASKTVASSAYVINKIDVSEARPLPGHSGGWLTGCDAAGCLAGWLVVWFGGASYCGFSRVDNIRHYWEAKIVNAY